MSHRWFGRVLSIRCNGFISAKPEVLLSKLSGSRSFLKTVGKPGCVWVQHCKAVASFDNELGCLFCFFCGCCCFCFVFFALEKYYRLILVFRQLKSLTTNVFSGVLDSAPICAQISSRCSLGRKAHAYCMFPEIPEILVESLFSTFHSLDRETVEFGSVWHDLSAVVEVCMAV